MGRRERREKSGGAYIRHTADNRKKEGEGKRKVLARDIRHNADNKERKGKMASRGCTDIQKSTPVF